MPSFTENWPEIESVLSDRPSVTSIPVAPVSSEDRFASMIRVVLEASTDPRKAGVAVEALREAGFLVPESLASADLRELEETLKLAHAAVGPKSLRPVQKLAEWVVGRPEVLEPDAGLSAGSLREELRGINGIGSATADAILLFGLAMPSYPVDRATYRILARHGWIDPTVEYDEVRDLVTSALADDPARLARLSGSFERVGREFCKVGVPKCDRCPLRPWLPESGPVEP